MFLNLDVEIQPQMRFLQGYFDVSDWDDCRLLRDHPQGDCREECNHKTTKDAKPAPTVTKEPLIKLEAEVAGDL